MLPDMAGDVDVGVGRRRIAGNERRPRTDLDQATDNRPHCKTSAVECHVFSPRHLPGRCSSPDGFRGCGYGETFSRRRYGA